MLLPVVLPVFGLAAVVAGCAPTADRHPTAVDPPSDVGTTSTMSVPPSSTIGEPPISQPDFPTGVAGAAGTVCGATGAAVPIPPGARGGIQPTLPSTVTTAAKAPLPISGGTLLTLADGTTAIASDPDRDKIYVVDLAASKVTATIALQPGDEPGRLAVDAAGRVHVALRRGGALLSFDPKTGTMTGRRAACAAPRGVAYQATGDLVHVACASGELVSFPAAGGAATRTVTLDRDLRDVVVGKAGQLYVSTFRHADVLVVAADGTISQRMRPPAGMSLPLAGPPQPISASVGWRMMPLSGAVDGVVMLHQTGVDGTIDPAAGGYAGVKGCPGIVASVVTEMTPDSQGTSAPGMGLGGVTLAVDVAISSDGTQMALAAPGNAEMPNVPTVVIGQTTQMTSPNPCSFPGTMPPGNGTPPTGEVVAVSFLGTTSTVIAQTREPAALWRSDTGASISLATDSFLDTGHTLFHTNAGGGLACASCHPEGGEDGRVWNFACTGARRTQSIRGGISPTAPFHWDGSEMDFSRLMDDVFVGRMAGPQLAVDQKTSLQSWIDKIPALPATRGLDAAAVARGQALFNDAKVACSSCHAGSLLTNNATVDVGTGLPLQVPSLRGVVWRAPYMHTGCAPTLADRFTAGCGGDADKHGATSQLMPSQVGDLVTYLQSL